jgi:hypothetical protein
VIARMLQQSVSIVVGAKVFTTCSNLGASR